MPGQPKYCEECKGYGNLYEQTITRYGDKRIKENTPVKAIECDPCKGTGMITLKTEKVSEYDVRDEADSVISGDEADARVAEAIEETSIAEEVEKIKDLDEIVTLEEPGPGEEKMEDDEVVFQPKPIEPDEGEMPV